MNGNWCRFFSTIFLNPDCLAWIIMGFFKKGFVRNVFSFFFSFLGGWMLLPIHLKFSEVKSGGVYVDKKIYTRVNFQHFISTFQVLGYKALRKHSSKPENMLYYSNIKEWTRPVQQYEYNFFLYRLHFVGKI